MLGNTPPLRIETIGRKPSLYVVSCGFWVVDDLNSRRPIIAGACDYIRNRAVARAKSEFVERRASYCPGQTLLSRRDLINAQIPVWECLQQRDVGESNWIVAHTLNSSRLVAVPASLAFHSVSPPSSTRPRSDATGYACRQGLQDALRHAMLEVYERASTRALERRLTVPQVINNPRIHLHKKVSSFLDELSITYQLLHVQHKGLPSVFISALRDSAGKMFLGSACSLTITEAATRSTLEAIAVRDAVARHHRSKLLPYSSSLLPALHLASSRPSWLEGKPLKACDVQRASDGLSRLAGSSISDWPRSDCTAWANIYVEKRSRRRVVKVFAPWLTDRARVEDRLFS